MRSPLKTIATSVAAPGLAISLTVPATAQGSGPDGAFRDPATYDVAIAHITDTQYLAQCANGAGIFWNIRMRCQAIYEGMNQWIVDSAAERKIAYTAHTGDIIDSYWGNMPNLARGEFGWASKAQRVLEDAGMPNGILPGNHDTRYGVNATIYNSFFGPNRYEAASKKASQPYYQGPWRAGDNSHHVDTFTAGGAKFAVVYLGYEPSDAALAWADAEIKKRPDHNVIVATHAYLKPGAEPSGLNAPLSHDGARVRSQVVDPNRNVFLVLSGHEHGVGRNVRQDAGSRGHQVIELMADYQAYRAGWDGKGHAGFIRLLQMDVDGGSLTVDTYSPSLNSFRSRDYDTKIGRDYDGTEDEFTIPVTFIR